MARTTGSKTWPILPAAITPVLGGDPPGPLGNSLGFVTTTSAPESMTTR